MLTSVTANVTNIAHPIECGQYTGELVILSLDILSENCWNLAACAHRTPNTNFFGQGGGVCE